ncbi:asparagine synthase (glutamine-hydrolyzing) [bacterium]|nr:asparagine synthase (glutamine-hydrolyzing) [bacterium]
MCGIAGELSFGSPVDPVNLRLMADAILHRGPDDEGFYHHGRIGLAHRRLSILDLSANGHQPMWSHDRSLVIVFNGEVYNFREIKPDLEAKGYRFIGNSDTEVVVNAIHCWGLEEALKRFIGMFAFAVWDTRNCSLCLVRDRVGVKPLYYQKNSNNILFGSELKALYAHPLFIRTLRSKGLQQFFCFGYTVSDTTIYQDTYKVPAGHFLRISENGTTSLVQYWSLDSVKRGSFKGSFEEASEQLAALCDSAFSYRLVSDVPVGMFLSGGVDSSFLAMVVKKRLNVDLEQITIGFEDPLYDESTKAAAVANSLDLKHTIKTINAYDSQQALSRFVEIWDEPFGDTSGIPTSILCRLARQDVKVALSADGGDELFCGYGSYPSYNARYNRLRCFPFPVRLAAQYLLRALPYQALISAALSTTKGPRWNPQTIARYEKTTDIIGVRGPSDLIRVMNEKGWTMNSVGDLLNLEHENMVEGTVFEKEIKLESKHDFIDHMMRTDFTTFLADDILTKVDRASMAVSLECRDPLLDHRLAEFSFSLPLPYLYKSGDHKHILKQMMKAHIEPSVLNLPKRGFSIPLYDWLRGPWKTMAQDYLSSAQIKKTGVLNEHEVKKEMDNFYRYEGGRAEKIMLMLNFQMWAEKWL